MYLPITQIGDIESYDIPNLDIRTFSLVYGRILQMCFTPLRTVVDFESDVLFFLDPRRTR
jgi:hypothetical protein